MKSAIRAIAFDKDGTLLDYHKTWLPSIRCVAANLAQNNTERFEQLMMLGGFNKATGRIDAASPFAQGTALDLARIWHSQIIDMAVTDLEDADQRGVFKGDCSSR